MSSVESSPGIAVRPVTGSIGAEIEGVDLRMDLDDRVVEAIRRALLEWKVVFFRDQAIGHAEQIAFARRFGEVTRAHPHLEAVAGFPEILPVDRREEVARADNGDYGWHTDVQPSLAPPAFSMLRAEVVPPYGGDTFWTNLVTAYEALSPPLQRLADELRAVHQYTVPPGRYLPHRYRERVERIDSSALVTEHPIVRVHPETGEKALWVTPLFTRQILGLSPLESRRVLDIFFEHVARPEFTVRFRWQNGSVAFWDNRSTAHRVGDDIKPILAADESLERRLFRVTVAGDVPVGPDGAASVGRRDEVFVTV